MINKDAIIGLIVGIGLLVLTAAIFISLYSTDKKNPVSEEKINPVEKPEEKKEEEKHRFFRIAFKSPLSKLSYTFIFGISKYDKIETMRRVGDYVKSFEKQCHCKMSFVEEVKLNNGEEKRYIQNFQKCVNFANKKFISYYGPTEEFYDYIDRHRFQPIEEIIETKEGEKENEK